MTIYLRGRGALSKNIDDSIELYKSNLPVPVYSDFMQKFLQVIHGGLIKHAHIGDVIRKGQEGRLHFSNRKK